MTPTAGIAGSGLAAAFAAWLRAPQVAEALAKPGSVHLVIDPATGLILHASEASRALAGALAGLGVTALSRQIAAAAPADGPPRLARLRLDLRRIAPPVLCWLAHGLQEDGRPAILVIPTIPVTLPRAKHGRPDEQPAPAPASVPAGDLASSPEPPKREDRFLWRVDAAGTLTALTGPRILADLAGQRVADLAAAGRIVGADGMLAAMRERRTFRGERATLAFASGSCQVELSGAPLGRGDAAYSGYSGFGLIRSAPPALPDVGASPAAVVDAVSWAPVEEAASAPASAVVSPPAAAPLSTDEHAAFREIARALGARYAGDEAEPETARVQGGAVMPFPGPQAGPPDTRTANEPGPDAGILAGLPVPALVHRDGVILAANGRLLELAGHADLASLGAAGLGGLLPGLPRQTGADPGTRRTTLAAADGRACPVEAACGPCTWAEAPAECLIVRPLDETDAADTLAAERLAHAAQAEPMAGAEAALDALDTGVVTIDAAGRIVAVNRAAATLFSCDPREVVGGTFVALFDRESVLTVADLLRGAVPGPRAVRLAGHDVTLDVKPGPQDGRCVAVLDRPSRRAGITPSDPGEHSALGRLDRAFREPVTGMVQLADAMLREPFGPLGDPRYRGCLAEIRVTGETMLERVGKLLDLAALEAGSLRLEPRPLDLNDVAAQCVARLQAEAARGRIVMRTSFSSDLENLEADERSVSRAASLVIENAIRRSAAGGQIIVSTGSTEQAIALRVRDTGIGSAPVAASPGGEAEDGLALPRALVEANGGRLQLAAQAEDGTLVEIIMPTRRAANQ
ncbi:sensor histidine kinase [Methylobacterium mesophilicum]|uniref:sensor histidine kinase n=1 Tax=Methylobacterium mesophilicum TaxID=39956 RepID=UPI001FCE3B48|nr:PAS domain-containing protein [Methylobacterium mesophilicum]